MHFFDKPHLATLKNLILYQGRAGTTITCVKLAEVVAKVGRCEKKVLVKHFLHNRKEKKIPEASLCTKYNAQIRGSKDKENWLVTSCAFS